MNDRGTFNSIKQVFVLMFQVEKKFSWFAINAARSCNKRYKRMLNAYQKNMTKLAHQLAVVLALCEHTKSLKSFFSLKAMVQWLKDFCWSFWLQVDMLGLHVCMFALTCSALKQPSVVCNRSHDADIASVCRWHFTHVCLRTLPRIP